MKILPEFNRCRILVVGDVMLDKYYWGEVSRISPEAPVPIIKIMNKTNTLGGAGNVALNLNGLECETALLGVCGEDESATLLDFIIEDTNIFNNLIKIPELQTTTKTRLISNNQQLLRVDEEELYTIDNFVLREINKKIDDILSDTSTVIISDYGKGMFNTGLSEIIITKCNELCIPVFVDPKGTNWNKYRHATCITPNLNEFEAMNTSPSYLIDRLKLSYLLISKGSEGMSLIYRGNKFLDIRAKAKEVYDVSGAGDTVIATLAATHTSGLSILESAKLANLAAGVVVGKIGTKPISRYELEAAVYGATTKYLNKISPLNQIDEIISRIKSEKKKIVFTNGCFDIIHSGHIKLLHAAKELGDYLILGLNSDESIRKLKGDGRPKKKEEERAEILSSIECINLIVIFNEETPINLIKIIKPDVIVKGGDYTPEKVIGYDIIKQYDGKVVILDIVDGFSTTGLIDSIRR